jgi:hypothetical protein
MDYEKTQPSKQDKTIIEDKIKEMEKSNKYDIYLDEPIEKYIELITKKCKLGDKISYISYIEKDKTIKYRSGGFLSNNKELPYFVLRSSIPFNRSKYLTFPVQYKNLRGLMIKKEQVHLSKKSLADKVKEEVKEKLKDEVKEELEEKIKKEVYEEISKEVKAELNRKRRDTGRLHNFLIYIDNEFYKGFQDKNQRLKHTETKKFKELSKNKDVKFKFFKNNKLFTEE